MDNEIIKSKGGSQFHPMIPVILFLCCVPAFSSGNYIALGLLLVLMIVTLVMDKTIQINITTRKVKNGMLSSWDDLSMGGYISIFSETSGIKMQARVQSTTVKTKELKLNYIQGRIKKHIYTAKSMDEAEETARLLSSEWDVGVYDAMNKNWIIEKSS